MDIQWWYAWESLRQQMCESGSEGRRRVKSEQHAAEESIGSGQSGMRSIKRRA
jgi:hypothetical protein